MKATFLYDTKINENNNVSAVVQKSGQGDLIEFEITQEDLYRMIKLYEMKKFKSMLSSMFSKKTMVEDVTVKKYRMNTESDESHEFPTPEAYEAALEDHRACAGDAEILRDKAVRGE